MANQIDGKPTLKECPLCGSNAAFVCTTRDDNSSAPRPHHAYRIECSSCELFIEETGRQWWSGHEPPPEDAEDRKARDEVVRRWNNRNTLNLPRARHPAEMELDEIEGLLDIHMGPRWRRYRGAADALGVLLHEKRGGS